ncbi:uncharacterized protein LOC125779373 [Bactrocera dorsalis]|uniref:Uncharacterized protein LOC125779373 n=1 Tax=Bactrocera dorsalis TaxID=27457 RepID=A0ABM3K5A9_BACDO|nr:uncharacterized protein LOC125779373 [Bactrocera dorsalis]
MKEVQTVQNANSNDSAVAVNGGAGVQSHATDAISTNDDSTVATNNNVTTRIQSNGDISANGNISTNGNMRHASVREIANTLPEFDPTNNASITVEQFIDRVDRVEEAYRWDEKFLLLAIYTRLKGLARMWLDASPTLHTTWENFADALRHEFGSDRDEAEIHFVMANATRKPKEIVKEYCFRVAALGIRYKLSEAAIIRYARAGLKHRELQQSIAAMKFTTMKQMRDAIEDYFINRGGLSEPQVHQPSKRDNNNEKYAESTKQNGEFKAQLKCYNCNVPGHFANKCPLPQKRHRCTTCNKVHPNGGNCEKTTVTLRRLGAINLDECFKKLVYIKAQPYIAFIDTGSQCSTFVGQ